MGIKEAKLPDLFFRVIPIDFNARFKCNENTFSQSAFQICIAIYNKCFLVYRICKLVCAGKEDFLNTF